MKIGFTGTQIGMSDHQKEQMVLELQKYEVAEFHHGDCIGADADAHNIIRAFFPECKIVIHPPTVSQKRAWCKGDEIKQTYDYLTRNKHIVNDSELLVGSPSSNVEELRSGTWSTIRYAKKTFRQHIVLPR